MTKDEHWQHESGNIVTLHIIDGVIKVSHELAAQLLAENGWTLTVNPWENA